MSNSNTLSSPRPPPAPSPFQELIIALHGLGLKFHTIAHQGSTLALVVDDYACNALQFDAKRLLDDDLSCYPLRCAGDDIIPGTVQWIDGSHPNLQYRGNPLKRHKMWFQEGPVDKHILVYGYTGWQYGVALATFSVDDCQVLDKILKHHNQLLQGSSFVPANHGIVTQYRDGVDNIGMHSDKIANMAPQSLITIVKLGPGARPFRVESLEGETLFHKPLAPGTAIIMTTESNLLCKHGVPAVEEGIVEVSGSIVFRTILREETVEDIQKKRAKTEASRAKRMREKEAALSTSKRKALSR